MKTIEKTKRKKWNAESNGANRRVDGKISTAIDSTVANGSVPSAASNGARRETNTKTRTKSPKIGKTNGARVRDVGVNESDKGRCFNL